MSCNGRGSRLWRLSSSSLSRIWVQGSDPVGLVYSLKRISLQRLQRLVLYDAKNATFRVLYFKKHETEKLLLELFCCPVLGPSVMGIDKLYLIKIYIASQVEDKDCRCSIFCQPVVSPSSTTISISAGFLLSITG